VERVSKSFDVEGLGELAESLYVEFEKEILPRLKEITEETKRYLYLIAWLNTKLEGGGLGRIIITGGFAVEVYTGRIYRTMDVDVIVEGINAGSLVERFLEKFSEKIARGFLPKYELLQLKSIEVVSVVYGRKSQPTKLVVGDFHVYVEPVEELVITYLVGWRFRESTEDRDKAYWLYALWRERIDHEYLESRAVEEGVYDYLRALQDMLKR
jgi:hypothetical protein